MDGVMDRSLHMAEMLEMRTPAVVFMAVMFQE